MRLLFLILTACLLFTAQLSAQTITLSGKHLPLETVFSAIKKQTGYVVFWNTELKKLAKPVSSFSVKNMPLSDFMDVILKDQSFTYEISEKNIILSKKNDSPLTADFKSTAANSDTAKKITVKGRIINEKGDPAIATITIKGKKNAVSSNANGEFILKQVEANAILIVSGINIESYEVKINGNSDLKNIIVKTKIKEEETVVIANTGYQKLKPNEITGSVTVIDNKTLNQQTGTNIIDRLNGVTSSLLFNVGKKTSDGNPNNIAIRGLSTINGPTDPLIILDNFQYDGDINNINPFDVLTVTILKDAAATSIYGALGGNGVIVITTKKSQFNQKLNVGFNAGVIVTQKPDLYVVPQMSSTDYINLEEYVFNKGLHFALDNNDYSSITPVVRILSDRKAGKISSTDSARQIDALKQLDYRDDLNKYFYQNALTRQYSLNLNGGGNNIAWLISGSYDKNIGSLDTKADKVNVRLNNNYRLVKNGDVSFSVYYTNASSESGKTLPDRLRNAPYITFADENGIALAVGGMRSTYTDTIGGGHLLNWKKYPLEDYKHDKTTTRREQMVASIEAKYQLLKGLDLNISYQYQREWFNTERYADIQSYAARDIINRFTKLSRSTAPDTLRVPLGGILDVSNNGERSQNFRVQLNFQRKWGEHAINTMIAGERRESITDPANAYTLYGYSKDPLTQGRVDFNTEYAVLPSGSPGIIPGNPRSGKTLIQRFVSFLGNVAYTYKQRYSVSASARRDAANVFGVSTNDKWKPLWSTGLGWEISREKFYQLNYLPYLKLRITWGYSGNVDLKRSAQTILSYSSADGTTNSYGLPFASASRKNPDLRWEKSRQLNMGIDFASKNRVIAGSIEYYQKEGTDLYGETLYDYTTYGGFGGGTIPANVANMKGNGIDVNIQIKNIDQQFKWNTTVLFNYTTSITTKYLSPFALNGSTLVSDGSLITPVVGKPLYAIAAYRWGGLDATGNPRGYLNDTLSTRYTNIFSEQNKNGINSSSIVYIGSSNPTYFGSLINEFGWKRFLVSVNIAYRLGYYFKKSYFSESVWLGSGGSNGDYVKRWQNPGDELLTNVPAFIYPDPPGVIISDRDIFFGNSAINVLKGDNIRLQYINLSYSFTRQHQRFPFSNIQIYGNVANLGIIWRANKQKIDPDYPSSIPPSKSFSLGIRASL